MIIKSKRFILRPFRKGDEKSLIENISDKYIYKHTLHIPYPYRLKDAKHWLKKCKTQGKKRKKTEINFAIDLGGSGIGLMAIEKHKAEIGYWIGKKYRNQGITTDAIKMITDFGFEKLKLSRIFARVFSNNTASISVLKKNNYKFEGLMKKYHLKNGKLIDAMLYAKTK